jgi:glycosyltransferase involved in cell wall biosynthesis
MNFLFLNSSDAWGGNEKWTHMAAHAIAKEHNVFLAYQKDILGNRFTIDKFKLPFWSEIDLYTISRVVSLVRENKIEVLIPTKQKDYMIAGIASKICGTKNILRLGIVRRLKSWHQNIVYNKLPDGIIVNAHRIKDALLEAKFMRAEKIAVIYNGLDLEKLKNTSPDEGTLKKPFPFLISAMGTLTRRKGFDFLLKGFAHFLSISHAEDAGLIIIGDGSGMDTLKMLANSLNITERVIFTGFLEAPYPYLGMSDIFAMTSKNEGISNSLLEAAYLKNALISTISGGIEEIIEHGGNGYLIEYGDVTQLAQCFIELYSNQSRKIELAEKAHQTVSSTFSLEKMKNEIIRFCTER